MKELEGIKDLHPLVQITVVLSITIIIIVAIYQFFKTFREL